MTAIKHVTLVCDAPACVRTFTTDCTTNREARAEARQGGWSYPARDLCPVHTPRDGRPS